MREILQAFLDFRETTLTRQYQHKLEIAENRLHVVAGLLTALNNLDAIIDILRHAPDGTTAKQEFQRQFDLSERQCDAILAMPLRRLTGLERENLETEHQDLLQERERLQLLLSDRRELLKSMKKELRALKKKFSDERRTRIQTEAERQEETQQLEEIIAEEVEAEVVPGVYPKGLRAAVFSALLSAAAGQAGG